MARPLPRVDVEAEVHSADDSSDITDEERADLDLLWEEEFSLVQLPLLTKIEPLSLKEVKVQAQLYGLAWPTNLILAFRSADDIEHQLGAFARDVWESPCGKHKAAREGQRQGVTCL